MFLLSFNLEVIAMDPPDFNDLIPELHYYVHRYSTPDWKIVGPPRIPFIDITYLLEGRAEYIINGTRHILKKGDLLCVPKGASRLAQCVPGVEFELYSVNFFLKDRQGRETTLPFPLISPLGHAPELVAYLHDIHDEWLRRENGFELKIRGLLLLILHQLVNRILNNKNFCNIDWRIKRDIHYISENFQRPLTIGGLAEMAGLSAVYYGMLFKKNMGVTFHQYLNSVRLNYAVDCLKCCGMTIGELSEHCGFSDIYHFSKLFKKRFGVSPKQMAGNETVTQGEF
jgi:AraC-like DNA-binding protein